MGNLLDNFWIGRILYESIVFDITEYIIEPIRHKKQINDTEVNTKFESVKICPNFTI